MLRKTVIIIPMAVLALGGCGGGGVDVDAANESAAVGQEYKGTDPLLQALNNGGVECSPGGEEKQPGAAGTTLSFTQICTSRDGGFSLTAVVYPGRIAPELAAEGAQSMAQNLGDYGASSLVLSGPNWYLTSTDEDSLVASQKAIGGQLIQGSSD